MNSINSIHNILQHEVYYFFSPALLRHLLLFSCIAWTFSLPAQWMRQHPVLKMEWILDIDVSADGYGNGVGGDDMVLKLDPAIMEWYTLAMQDLEWTLRAVDYLDGTMGNVMVAGVQGVIVLFDGGDTWNQLPGLSDDVYTVKAISMNELVAITYTSSTRDLVDSPVIILYPNPADEKVNADIPDGYDCIHILSPDGRIVGDCIMDDIHQVDVSTLVSGVYFIRFSSEKGYRYGKVSVFR